MAGIEYWDQFVVESGISKEKQLALLRTFIEEVATDSQLATFAEDCARNHHEGTL